MDEDGSFGVQRDELWLIPAGAIILEPGEGLGDWLRRQLREKRAAVVVGLSHSSNGDINSPEEPKPLTYGDIVRDPVNPFTGRR